MTTRGGPIHWTVVAHQLLHNLQPANTKEPHMPDTKTRPDMYEDAYNRISRILDTAIGTEVEDGAGAGLAEEVALLAQRYLDLRRRVLTQLARIGWEQTVADIEAAELRDAWWDAA